MADWKSALAVINTALGVIAGAGSIPGINLVPYVSLIAAGASALQAGINAGVQVAPYIEAIAATFSGTGLPTAQQVSDLRATIAELEAAVDAPLPPKEDGEPD